MAAIDHLILNVNEISSSVDFYVSVLGFELEGEDGYSGRQADAGDV